jgi:hypothetical protein
METTAVRATANSDKPPKTEDTLATDLLWGAQPIADFIGRELRDVYYLLQQKHLDADKCGDSWVTTKTRLRRQFNGERADRQGAS